MSDAEAGTQESDADSISEPASERVYADRGPSLTPTYIRLGGIIGATFVLVNIILNVETGFNRILLVLTYAIGGILTVREVYRIFLLRRVYYRLTQSEIVRGFRFLGRHQRRTIPINQLRGVEINQSRTENLLGVGSLRFLTGGSNRSLGFLSFDYVDDPGEIESKALDLIEREQRT